jgi:toxin CcdB
MARFDVHRNLGDSARVPYLLDVQSDFLAALRSRVVVPLVPLARFGKPMTRLNPIFEIDGVPHAMATTDLAGVDIRMLGKIVASLAAERDRITQAIDFLLQGF